jgi:hypothetical protein
MQRRKFSPPRWPIHNKEQIPMKIVKQLVPLLVILTLVPIAYAQSMAGWLGDLAVEKAYRLKRISSYDRSGGNADYRSIEAGQTLTLLDEKGPGEISHIWITINSPEKYHLKKLVLRMYWDDEHDPSVEAPSVISLDSATGITSCTNRCHLRSGLRRP